MNSLSVIVLNHNTYQLTCDCIRSIYASNLKNVDLEVILVDNGSDEPCPVAFTELFSGLVYIRSEINVGFAKGNNIGLKLATKAYILLLNSDTIIFDPDTFAKTIGVLQTFGNKIVLTTKLLTSGNSPQVAYGPIPSLKHELMLTTFVYKFLSAPKKADLLLTFVANENRIVKQGYITATYLLFARDALDSLPDRKLYDNTFMYGEELFWATDWLKRGYEMYYCADVSIIHLIGQSLKTSHDNNRRRRFYQALGEKQFLLWRYPLTSVIALYLLRIMRLIVLFPFSKDLRTRLVALRTALSHDMRSMRVGTKHSTS